MPDCIKTCSAIAVNVNAGKKVNAPKIRTVKDKKIVNVIVSLRTEPDERAYVFLFDILAAIAIIGIMTPKRPINIAIANVTL